jgi:hypothetical protein
MEELISTSDSAVSLLAGVATITSAYLGLFAYRVELCVDFFGLIAVANRRGLRESGRLLAAPTFGYVIMLALLIVVRLAQSYFGGGPIYTVLQFSNGVVFLAAMSAVLLTVFSGDTESPHSSVPRRRFHRLHSLADRHGPPPLPTERAALAAELPHQRAGRGLDVRLLLVVLISKFTMGA